MNSLRRKIVKKIQQKFNLEYRKYKGVILPPIEMRLMGEKFYDDQFYLDSSLREGDRFVNRLKVNENTELLEIGCASGRSVIGLFEKAGRIKRYVGVDANLRNVNWCNKYLASKHDFCEFHYIDLWHILFNPNGSLKLDDHFKLDFPGNSFDILYLQSVLPNSVDWEIRIFAKEYYRLLKPGGILFLTDFIEENVPDMTENPENYIMECTYPRQIVRFEKNYFLKMFTDAGFVLDSYEQGTEVDSQSAVYFKKPL
jgi:ubiquinone/menaquinone biosynthesis C-methylase UbiE